MLTWRTTLAACVIAAYLAWAVNDLWHNWPADVEPEPVATGELV